MRAGGSSTRTTLDESSSDVQDYISQASNTKTGLRKVQTKLRQNHTFLSFGWPHQGEGELDEGPHRDSQQVTSWLLPIEFPK